MRHGLQYTYRHISSKKNRFSRRNPTWDRKLARRRATSAWDALRAARNLSISSNSRDVAPVVGPADWYIPPELDVEGVVMGISEREGSSVRDGICAEESALPPEDDMVDTPEPPDKSFDEGCCCWSRNSGDPLIRLHS
jgi:hypothetical protein